MRKIFFLLAFLTLSVVAKAATDTSVAGLFQLEGSGRTVYNFNLGWHFHLGDINGAEGKTFDDSKWTVVNAPHSVRLEPSEASGGRNYQGIAWYRKHFTVPADMNGKDVSVHFEAIMGKQVIYVNGQKVKEHLGGYLPITIDLTSLGVKAGDKCVIAVKTDNSDDKTYPPGKKQSALDFCYHGGMYRDVWLIGKSPVAITDAIERNKVAGGGVFLHYDNITEDRADVFVNVEVGNSSNKAVEPTVMVRIKDANGKTVATLKKGITIAAGQNTTAYLGAKLKNIELWSPENPYLYNVEISIQNGKQSIDGGIVRMGIRKAEFRGKDGFWLNGKPYHQLIGGNRHQDFAYVGNAMPNSQQWRDAKRLKDAGMTIIRAAHYPQDPSFMDACDELGLFIIVPTPGWQYWNKDPNFGELVHKNTREIIRRDRNHPCVLMWEPILNETRYPEDFSIKALEITREEFPYPGKPVAAADMQSAGVKENYDVLYGWPDDIGKETTPTDKCVFTREFGEMVDDWYAHNCLNRAARYWGEKPMLMAALSLANTYGEMYHGQRQFIGGCQWHPFDHQRGYHPDPYLGGIYDAFRQKKYAFEMFRSQITDSEPMVFIANEMTQFSDNDVTIFSNCDSVRLTMFEGDKVVTLPVVHNPNGQPCAPVIFKDFWDFWKAREYSYKQRNWQKVSLVAEGIKDGKVVVTEKKMPSRRSTKIRLYADTLGMDLTADGSDFIVVVAEITDDNGNVKRLAKDNIVFTVEGEGRIIGDGEQIMANPRAVEWGSAPVLIQATDKPGKITITARSAYEGNYAPAADTLTIESKPATLPACFTDRPTAKNAVARTTENTNKQTMTDEERRKTLEEVNQQQIDFGIQ
ncbi:MAG: glycoside hydrolase family 2 TIM barrel-domain containing protein [Prevotellaceae bacterium]|nr:glycoside hydrolase family 2 TIM barrel-domain containing protein [Prevotellaceae bacterium]